MGSYHANSLPGVKAREYLKEGDGDPGQGPVQAPRHLVWVVLSAPTGSSTCILSSKDGTGEAFGTSLNLRGGQQESLKAHLLSYLWFPRPSDQPIWWALC